MPENEASPPFLPPNIDLRDYRDAYVRVSSVRDGRLSFVRNDSAFKAGFCLMLWSWHQLPAASLPDDDHALARLVDVSLRKWRGMKSEALVEFVLCADGRWYHRDLAERALSAWAKKQSYKRKLIRRIELESEEWSALRLSVFKRDSFTCRYCGASNVRLECDHVIPVSRGGPSIEGNLVTSCKECNRAKGSKLLHEWERLN